MPIPTDILAEFPLDVTEPPKLGPLVYTKRTKLPARPSKPSFSTRRKARPTRKQGRRPRSPFFQPKPKGYKPGDDFFCERCFENFASYDPYHDCIKDRSPPRQTKRRSRPTHQQAPTPNPKSPKPKLIPQAPPKRRQGKRVFRLHREQGEYFKPGRPFFCVDCRRHFPGTQSYHYCPKSLQTLPRTRDTGTSTTRVSTTSVSTQTPFRRRHNRLHQTYVTLASVVFALTIILTGINLLSLLSRAARQ